MSRPLVEHARALPDWSASRRARQPPRSLQVIPMQLRRNVSGALLIVIGVGLGTISMAALAADSQRTPIALGVISGLLAVVSLAYAWLLMLDGGTPIERARSLAPERAKPARLETPPRPALAEEAAEP